MASAAPAPSSTPAAELHPATAKLLERLDAIAASGRHAADPREPAVQTAQALAEFFRTPD